MNFLYEDVELHSGEDEIVSEEEFYKDKGWATEKNFEALQSAYRDTYRMYEQKRYIMKCNRCDWRLCVGSCFESHLCHQKKERVSRCRVAAKTALLCLRRHGVAKGVRAMIANYVMASWEDEAWDDLGCEVETAKRLKLARWESTTRKWQRENDFSFYSSY